MSDYTLEFEAVLDPPPERVFEAITDARHLQKWFCDVAESGARLGGRLMLKWTGAGASEQPFTGQWTGFDPPSRCVYEGGHDGYPDRRIGRITWSLAPAEDGTRVKVTHAMPRDPRYDEWVTVYRDEWPRAIERLKAYLTPSASSRPTVARSSADPELEAS